MEVYNITPLNGLINQRISMFVLWVTRTKLENNTTTKNPRQRERISVSRWKWLTRWWFQIFFIFIPSWGRFPFWLIFFKWVGSTTNQLKMVRARCKAFKDIWSNGVNFCLPWCLGTKLWEWSLEGFRAKNPEKVMGWTYQPQLVNAGFQPSTVGL